MYGTTLSRTGNAIRHMLRHPNDGVRWLADRLTSRSPLDHELPWISFPCIRYLDRLINRDMRVFEYGGGGSTLYFLKRGCAVKTVENSRFWRDKIVAHVRADNRLEAASFEMVLVEMVERPDGMDETQVESSRQYIAKIDEGGPWDVVFVDGVDGNPPVRIECVRRAREMLTADGVIILDDAWRDEYAPVPKILKDFHRREFWGLGTSRWGVTKTDVYHR